MGAFPISRVDVKDFGGVMNGVHNDAPALRAAIENIRNNSAHQALTWSGTLFFAPGEAAIEAPANLVIVGGEGANSSIIALGYSSATADLTAFTVAAGGNITVRNATLQGPNVSNGKTIKFVDHAGSNGTVTFEHVLSTGSVKIAVGVGAVFVQDSVNSLTISNSDTLTHQGNGVWTGSTNGSGVVLGGGSSATDVRVNAVTDGGLSPGGVVDNFSAINSWLALGTSQQLYAPGGTYAATFSDTQNIPVVPVGEYRHLVGDGLSTVYQMTVAATRSVGVWVKGTLLSEAQAFSGTNSSFFGGGILAVYGVPGADATLVRNSFTGQAAVKFAGDAGASGDYRLRDWGSNFTPTGDLTYGTPNAVLCVAATSPDRRGSTHFIGSIFSVTAPANAPASPASFAHCTYLNPGIDALFLGAEFRRSGNNPSGGGYGLHYNSDSSLPVANYSLCIGSVFGPEVVAQLYPNPTAHTMAVGCGFTLASQYSSISMRARANVASALVGCSLNGSGTANVDDSNATDGSQCLILGSYLEGAMVYANLWRTATSAYGLWRVLASEIANTNDATTTYGLIQASGETEIAFSTFARSGHFGTDSGHAQIGGGTLTLAHVRVLDQRSVWLVAGNGDCLLQTDGTRYAAGGTTGDGLLLFPTAAHAVRVRGVGNRFEGASGGPSVNVSIWSDVAGQLRPPPGDEAYTIPAGKSVTITCNTDFVRLSGPNDLQTLKMAGSDTGDANGPLRVFTGFRLAVYVASGFTVASGGNIASTSLAIGAHATGTVFTLTLVDRVWY